ncbi:hypothetical protein EC900039_3840A, partial [Escherichia coli 90.0039]
MSSPSIYLSSEESCSSGTGCPAF